MEKQQISVEKNMKQKKIIKGMFIALSVLIVIYLLYTFGMAAKHTFFKADDFSHANTIGARYENLFDAFGASFAFMAEVYETWQGTYFSMFCQAFLSPLNGFGIIQMKLVMIANVCAIFGSIFVLACAISKYVMGRVVWHYVVPMYAVVMYAANAYKAWTEIYYWFSGATSYSMPFICMCMAIAFFLFSSKSEKKRSKIIWGVFAAVFIFMSSGGSLAVAGTGCYITLLLAAYETWREKKFCPVKWGIFLAGLIGALINTIAPGNYVRHDVIDATGLHVDKAIEYMFDQTKAEYDWLMNETSFFGFMLLALIVGIFAGRYLVVKKAEVITFTVALLVTPLVTVFPVVLAYGEGYFPNRCQFVLDLVMIGVYLMTALVCGSCLQSVFETQKEVWQIATVCILIAFATFSGNAEYNMDNLVTTKTSEMLESGEIERYANHCKNICIEIENSKEKHVVLTSFPGRIDYYAEFTLSTDSTAWLNQAIALYYGKESVTLSY